MTEIPWKDLRAVLQQAHMIIVDDVTENTPVYADCRGDAIMLVTRQGDEPYCILRKADNETAIVKGSSYYLVVTSHPDELPNTHLTIYKRWDFANDPAFSVATQPIS